MPSMPKVVGGRGQVESLAEGKARYFPVALEVPSLGAYIAGWSERCCTLEEKWHYLSKRLCGTATEVAEAFVDAVCCYDKDCTLSSLLSLTSPVSLGR